MISPEVNISPNRPRSPIMRLPSHAGKKRAASSESVMRVHVNDCSSIYPRADSSLRRRDGAQTMWRQASPSHRAVAPMRRPPPKSGRGHRNPPNRAPLHGKRHERMVWPAAVTGPNALPLGPGGNVLHGDHRPMIPCILAASASSEKGFVITCIPCAAKPLPTGEFSA